MTVQLLGRMHTSPLGCLYVLIEHYINWTSVCFADRRVFFGGRDVISLRSSVRFDLLLFPVYAVLKHALH